MKGRSLLRVANLAAPELIRLLDLAARVKSDAAFLRGTLAGRSMALLFEKPSLRTKASFAVGAGRLGMQVTPFAADEIALGRRETVADGARTLSRYFDLLVLRTHEHVRVEQLAEHASVPVINGLSELEHPCQALADLLTLRERYGVLDGLELAWIGDGNNVCHSLLVAASLVGAGVRVATPEGHEPNAAVVSEARRLGGRVEVGHEPARAVLGAHAVCTDTWVSMGREAEAAARDVAFAAFRVDAALMQRARPDAIFLHCLPAHRGQEVTDDVLDSPASRVFEQAENRLHVQVALMALLLGAA